MLGAAYEALLEIGVDELTRRSTAVRRESNPVCPHGRRKAFDVIDVAREDGLVKSMSADRDVCVDDVLGVCAGEKQADASSFGVVEGDHVDVALPQQRRDPRLPRWISPGLGDTTGGHRDRVVAGACLGNHDGDRAIASIQRDQRTGIEN
jgi:hypothetical protein